MKKDLLTTLGQRAGLNTLNDREKWILLAGAIFVLSFAIFQFVLVPLSEKRDTIEQSIQRKEQDLLAIEELRQEYLTLKNQEGSIQDQIAKREASFTLFTFLEQQAGKAEVKSQIKYMKPSTVEGEDLFDEIIIEMKLQRVSLQSLVNFLLLIESEEKVVFIRRISIQEGGEEQGYLDAILQVATFEQRRQN